jgi:hypothetical protein
MSCWFSQFCDRPCDGPTDRAHLLPKSRIKRELRGQRQDLIDEAVWHPAVWVHACRFHHGQFDNRILRVKRSDVPRATEEWAVTMDMVWSLDRDFDA